MKSTLLCINDIITNLKSYSWEELFTEELFTKDKFKTQHLPNPRAKKLYN